jgi:hypothetical protein
MAQTKEDPTTFQTFKRTNLQNTMLQFCAELSRSSPAAFKDLVKNSERYRQQVAEIARILEFPPDKVPPELFTPPTEEEIRNYSGPLSEERIKENVHPRVENSDPGVIYTESIKSFVAYFEAPQEDPSLKEPPSLEP